MRPAPFVFLICLAETLSMTGTMYFPALLPSLQAEWGLTNTEAGWINGVFFAGYAVTAPFLVGLTDRIDARRIYLPSAALAALSLFLFGWLAEGTWSAAALRLLAGIGLAGTYMPGLRALSDNVSGPKQSRHIVFYTATYGIGTALSVYFAGLLAPLAVPVGDGEAWCAVYEARAPGSDVPVYMIDHEVLFDRPYLYDPPGGTCPDNLARFTVLSRGALQLCKHLGWIPNVIHAHDWPTALVPIYLATRERRGMFRRVASVLSLHEVMYQGRFHGHERAVAQLDEGAFHADGAEEYGELNVLKGGSLFADMLVATSPERAEALCTSTGGYGLDGVFARRAGDLTGIASGTDESSWEDAARLHVEVYRRAIERRKSTG